jgi:DNA-binding MarR family transcriptional regulator
LTGAQGMARKKNILSQIESSQLSPDKHKALHNDDAKHESNWTFLSNHSHVLIALSKNPGMVLREVALLVGITERAVQKIISDLERDEFISKKKIGRQNIYKISQDKKLRHHLESHKSIGDLIQLIIKT